MKNKAPRLINAAYFTCIIASLLLSALLVADVLGRYMTKKEASEEAGVAAFRISTAFTGDTSQFHLSAAENITTVDYTFSVSGECQVALRYDVILTMPIRPLDSMTFTLDGISPTVSGDGLTYTFRNVGEEAPGRFENPHILTVVVDLNDDSISLDGVKVNVVATQVAGERSEA